MSFQWLFFFREIQNVLHIIVLLDVSEITKVNFGININFTSDFEYLVVLINTQLNLTVFIFGFGTFCRWYRVTITSLKHYPFTIAIVFFACVIGRATDHFCENASKTPNISSLIVIMIQKNNFRWPIPPWTYCLCKFTFLNLLISLFFIIFKHLSHIISKFLLSWNSLLIWLFINDLLERFLFELLNLFFKLRLCWHDTC